MTTQTEPVLADKWVDLLKDIVAIDSRTIEAWQGTELVSQKLGQALEQLGFTLQWHDARGDEPQRGRHLVAVRNPQAARRIIFVGHSDVVLDAAKMPVSVDEKTGRLKGSGTCDMKGGDVLMLRAIEYALEKSAVAGDVGMVVLINSSEETGSVSFPKLQLQFTDRAIACLCFEPARFAEKGAADEATAPQFFVSGRKGVARFELTCFGRSGHAGSAHPQGVNALRELARKTEEIESLTDYSKNLLANVGMFHSGQVANQIPDEATIRFELRAFHSDVLDEACEKVKAICSTPTVTSAADGATTSFKLAMALPYPAWHPSDADQQLAQSYMKHLQTHGLNMSPVESSGGSDASILAAYMPTIDGLGPLGGRAHSPHEWVDVKSFEARARAAGDLIVELSGG